MQKKRNTRSGFAESAFSRNISCKRLEYVMLFARPELRLQAAAYMDALFLQVCMACILFSVCLALAVLASQGFKAGALFGVIMIAAYVTFIALSLFLHMYSLGLFSSFF